MTLSEIAAIVTALAALGAAIYNGRKSNADASGEITKSAIALVDPLNDAIEKLNNQCAKMQKTIDKMEGEKSDILAENEIMKKKISDLEQELKEIKLVNAEENDAFRKRIAALEKENDSLTEERQKLLQRIDDLEDELNQIKKTPPRTKK